ncbi:MAG: hypothetical protein PHC43_00120 [Candidatus Marinimicrobia bacterium]|jgi:hypothetical protein|nr:hypothetical protein [Candidatus Neomarinimicrobiota bacterium]
MPETVVNFKDDCIDPLAKLVLLEAISFAVEKAESRLESLGKIFPKLEKTGQPALDDIKEIQSAIESLNVCAVKGPASLGGGPVPSSGSSPAAFEIVPPEVLKRMTTRDQKLVKEMPEEHQLALTKILTKNNPFVDWDAKEKPVKELEKEPEKEVKKRTLPTSWGELKFKNKTYTSPGDFLSSLHGGDVSKIRGKENYLRQLDKEGYEIYIGGELISPDLPKEEVEKLKGKGMEVKLKKGKSLSPSPIEKTYPVPWTIVQRRSKEKGEPGEMLFVEDSNRNVIPPAIWRALHGDELDKLAPRTRFVDE